MDCYFIGNRENYIEEQHHDKLLHLEPKFIVLPIANIHRCIEFCTTKPTQLHVQRNARETHAHVPQRNLGNTSYSSVNCNTRKSLGNFSRNLFGNDRQILITNLVYIVYFGRECRGSNFSRNKLTHSIVNHVMHFDSSFIRFVGHGVWI